MPNHATPIIYWASGRPLGYLFSWGKFSFLIFSAWQEPCWAHKEAHQLLAQCLDKGITPAGAGELQSCLIYIVIYSAGIPVLPEYKLAFQHVCSHTPTVSSTVTGNYTQKQQPLAWWRAVLANQQWSHPLLWSTKESDSPGSIFFRFWGLTFCSNSCSYQVSFPSIHHSQATLESTKLFALHSPHDVKVAWSMVCEQRHNALANVTQVQICLSLWKGLYRVGLHDKTLCSIWVQSRMSLHQLVHGRRSPAGTASTPECSQRL